MKFKGLIAVLLLSVLLIDAVDGWRIKLPRIKLPRIKLPRIKICWRCIVKPACRLACPRVCQIAIPHPICSLACRRLCGKIKREAVDDAHITPLPLYMSFYDIDEDGFVTIGEFATTLGLDISGDGLGQCFALTDRDGDSKLTEEELFSSPCLIFAKFPDAPFGDLEASSDVPGAPSGAQTATSDPQEAPTNTTYALTEE